MHTYTLNKVIRVERIIFEKRDFSYKFVYKFATNKDKLILFVRFDRSKHSLESVQSTAHKFLMVLS